MMNPEVKRLWVEALRSGEYKQGLGALRSDNNEFCCLGVLCNLHAQTHPRVSARQKSRLRYMGASGFPPEKVLAWAGLGSRDPMVMVRGEINALSALNDGVGVRRRSFKQIAELIERQL